MLRPSRRNRRLDDRVGGQPLDRHTDLVAGLLGSLLDGLLFDPAHEPGGVHPGLVFDRPDEVPFRVRGGQPRNLLEPLLLVLDELLDVTVGLFDPLLGVGQRLFLASELLLPLLLLGELAVEVLLLLDEPLLEARDLLAPGLDGLVELQLGREDLFLGLDGRLPEARIGGLRRLGENPVRLGADCCPLPRDLPLEEKVRDDHDSGREDCGRDRYRDGCIHLGSPRPGGPKVETRLHDFPEATLPTKVLNWIRRFCFQRDRSFLRVPGSPGSPTPRPFRRPGRRPVFESGAPPGLESPSAHPFDVSPIGKDRP